MHIELEATARNLIPRLRHVANEEERKNRLYPGARIGTGSRPIILMDAAADCIEKLLKEIKDE